MVRWISRYLRPELHDVPDPKCTSIIIPNSVTSIDNYAFGGCEYLTNINIPNSVTTIGYEAFSGCTGLKSINIPESVTKIGYAAFRGC